MKQFTSAQEMLDFIKPYDYERTLKRDFYPWMENDLWDWVRQNRYFDNTYIRNLITDGDNDYRGIEERKEILGNNYFSMNPELYWEFLTEKRIISLPKFWQDEHNLTLSRAVELLTPVQPPSGIVFGYGNSYNNDRYQTAMKLLQSHLGGQPNGVYDEDMAEWLYIKKHTTIPKGEGYLVHEVDPDYLFKDWKPMVLGVDRLLWRMFGLNPDDLKPDPIGGPYAGVGNETVFGAMGDRAGYIGVAFDTADRAFESGDAKKVVRDASTYGDFAKGTKNWIRTIDGMEVLFSVSGALEEDINNGVISSSDIITDVVVEGVKTKASQAITGKAVEISLRVFFGSNPAGLFYLATATFLNWKYGEKIDEILDELAEVIKEYIKMDLMDDALHFDEWRQTLHERDIEAGIRMD